MTTKQLSNLNLHFNICNSADVYIAYDHRISTPSWITGNYINTGEKIYVTDSDLEYFNIWKRKTQTQPGLLLLAIMKEIVNHQCILSFINYMNPFMLM